MAIYFDSMQMHEEEFWMNQAEDSDDNHSFEQPKIFDQSTNLNDGFNSIQNNHCTFRGENTWREKKKTLNGFWNVKDNNEKVYRPWVDRKGFFCFVRFNICVRALSVPTMNVSNWFFTEIIEVFFVVTQVEIVAKTDACPPAPIRWWRFICIQNSQWLNRVIELNVEVVQQSFVFTNDEQLTNRDFLKSIRNRLINLEKFIRWMLSTMTDVSTKNRTKFIGKKSI